MNIDQKCVNVESASTRFPENWLFLSLIYVLSCIGLSLIYSLSPGCASGPFI